MADKELVNGLSKLIGYGIVLPAFFVLIPQILKVLQLTHGGNWCENQAVVCLTRFVILKRVLPIIRLLGSN